MGGKSQRWRQEAEVAPPKGHGEEWLISICWQIEGARCQPEAAGHLQKGAMWWALGRVRRPTRWQPSCTHWMNEPISAALLCGDSGETSGQGHPMSDAPVSMADKKWPKDSVPINAHSLKNSEHNPCPSSAAGERPGLAVFSGRRKRWSLH